MNSFAELLKNWERHSTEAANRTEISITLSTHDWVKIQAFAQAYGLDEGAVTEGLLHTAIKEAEQAIPYVKGTKVIRVEEGEEVYADAGKTPAYIEAEQKLATGMAPPSSV
ncbi:hypothetical protein ACWHY4_06225 [Pseudomonas sp. E2-15]